VEFFAFGCEQLTEGTMQGGGFDIEVAAQRQCCLEHRH
jgi:hypothetical protein